MRLTINRNNIVLSDQNLDVRQLAFKRRDGAAVSVRFLDESDTPMLLPTGHSLRFGAKVSYGDSVPLLVDCIDWSSPTGEDDDFDYVGSPSFNREGLNQLFDSAQNPPSVVLLGEFTWMENSTLPRSSNTLKIVVNNDVITGDEETSAPGAPPYPSVPSNGGSLLGASDDGASWIQRTFQQVWAKFLEIPSLMFPWTRLSGRPTGYESVRVQTSGSYNIQPGQRKAFYIEADGITFTVSHTAFGSSGNIVDGMTATEAADFVFVLGAGVSAPSLVLRFNRNANNGAPANHLTLSSDVAYRVRNSPGTSYVTLDETPAELISSYLPSRYAALGGDGKVLPSQIPAMALNTYLGAVASEAAMLALVGNRGDYCTRTDTGQTYILNVTAGGATLSNWILVADMSPDWSTVTGKPSTFTPTAHVLDSASHTISGKTAGQVLLATGATTFAFTSISGDATLSGAGSLTLANSGVSAGTYRSVTVDAKGRVTAGTNPTTLTGYGITDAATSAALTGHTGAASGAHAATAISNAPSGNIAATTVQAALNELDTEKVPTTRSIATTAPLTGGNTLAGNLTLGVSYATTSASGVVELATATEGRQCTSSTLALTPDAQLFRAQGGGLLGLSHDPVVLGPAIWIGSGAATTVPSNSLTIGMSTSPRADSVLIGVGVSAQNGCVVVGYNHDGGAATAVGAVMLGRDCVAADYVAVVVGAVNYAYGPHTVAMGSWNTVHSEGGVALGVGNHAYSYGVAVGKDNQSFGSEAITAGRYNTAHGARSVACGYTNTVEYCEAGVAVGAWNYVGLGADNSVALGVSNTVLSQFAAAVGQNNTVYGYDSAAFGRHLTVERPNTCAYGYGLTVAGGGNEGGVEIGLGSSGARLGSLRLGPNGLAALTVWNSSVKPTDGGSSGGAEPFNQLPRSMFTFRRNGLQFILDYNDGGTVKSLSLGTVA